MNTNYHTETILNNHLGSSGLEVRVKKVVPPFVLTSQEGGLKKKKAKQKEPDEGPILLLID